MGCAPMPIKNETTVVTTTLRSCTIWIRGDPTGSVKPATIDTTIIGSRLSSAASPTMLLGTRLPSVSRTCSRNRQVSRPILAAF